MSYRKPNRSSRRGRLVGVARLAPVLACGVRLAACTNGSNHPGSDPRAVVTVTETREPCAAFNPLRNVYFGDTHVHTALSLDAGTQGTRLRPDDAYRFAKGERVGIQPHDAEGNPLRTLQLSRPLDWAMVSDHAEWLGELHICATPGLEGYDSATCGLLRDDPATAFFILNAALACEPDNVGRFTDICGEDGARCVQETSTLWKEIQDAAEAAYDRTSACAFTAFVGYEWSGSPSTENLHRNVVFRNAQVPAIPTSYFDEPYPEGLWDALDRDCLDAGTGCDVLTIPHNSNLGSGRMFAPFDRNGDPFTRAYAERRAGFEPLVEIYQHKGDSECLPGAGVADELCRFEKLPFDNLGASNLGEAFYQLPTQIDFVRDALKRGLLFGETLGANPFRYGIIASTDTHIGTPGAVNERTFPGHGGAGKPSRDALPVGLVDIVGFSPGGLAAAWAEENSRDAIFEAFRRRETYGTSGPRMTVRFFGGWNYPANLCARGDFVRAGYRGGVPMGADLEAEEDKAPAFLVWAMRDPSAAWLQRVQIVKGWVENGELKSRTFDVVCSDGIKPDRKTGMCRDNSAKVDMTTCKPVAGTGAAQLAATWSDPTFDAGKRAVYYVRVLE
ncbi:MAG: DUF3604 domain-containing protein, partial [Myxococcales bacterium]|nr:DUF3604 domain-containing protein [Myxococcales bacterium]